MHLPGCSDSPLWISPQLYYRIPVLEVRRTVFPYTATDACYPSGVSVDTHLARYHAVANAGRIRVGVPGASLFKPDFCATKSRLMPSKILTDGVVIQSV